MASVMDKDFALIDAAQRIAVLKSDLDRRREFAVAQAARIDELKAALEPFAKCGEFMPQGGLGSPVIWSGGPSNKTVGVEKVHFRNAFKVMEKSDTPAKAIVLADLRRIEHEQIN